MDCIFNLYTKLLIVGTGLSQTAILDSASLEPLFSSTHASRTQNGERDGDRDETGAFWLSPFLVSRWAETGRERRSD